MKKLLLLLSAGFFCFLISCNDKKESGGMSDTAKKNMETAIAVNKCFESGDWSKIGDYIAADGIEHSGMNGEVKGLDSLKAMFAMYSKMMSNMKNEVVKVVADDDYVMAWQKETSTMNQDGMGMKAGSTNTMDAIEVSKFNKDGKVSDHWTFISWGDMMKMMPPPPMDNKMDTTKKMGHK